MKDFQPNLLHLNPESVSKVFLLVDSFTNLDINSLAKVDDLKSIVSDDEISSAMKFFILYYINKHLKRYNKNTFSYRQIKDMEDIAETEDFVKWESEIDTYIKSIIKICKLYLPEVERLYKNSLIVNELSDKYDSYKHTFELLGLKTIRLPLKVYNVDGTVSKDLEPLVKEKLRVALDENDVDAIIRNSFNIDLGIPPKILSLNYKDLGSIREAFYEVYFLYKNELDTFKNYVISEHKNFGKSKNKMTSSEIFRKLFRLPDEKLYANLSNKMLFAQMMFMSFHQLRWKFIRANNERGLSIDEYVYENIYKNIKKRKQSG